MKVIEDKKVIPLLKWVGGKRELIPKLSKYYSDLSFDNYIEPFFGVGQCIWISLRLLVKTNHLIVISMMLILI